MNTTDLSQFKRALDGSEVSRSVFRDRNGYWAKAWEDVIDVFVEIDGSQYELTPGEFRGLSREQQQKIQRAQSSPLPE